MQPALSGPKERGNSLPIEEVGAGPATMLRIAGTSRGEYITLFLLVLIGAALRFDFMRAVDFCIDGDEAIVGLMGKHILEGRGMPTFYYGQHYMGSLEAILSAGSFAMLGVSPFALQLVPFLCSLVVIALTFFLGRALLNTRAGLVSAALMAIAPSPLLVWSSKARGGFIEVLVLGAVAMLVCIAWIRSSPSRLRYPITLGLILGVGWWVNTQIVYFILPIGIFSLIHVCGTAACSPSEFGKSLTSPRVLSRALPVALTGCLAFCIGSAAYWIYNIRLGFPSAGMFVIVDFPQLKEHLKGLSTVALPMIVGAQRFWQKTAIFPGAKYVALFLYLVPLIVLLVARWRSLCGLLLGRIDRKHPIELLVLQCLACLAIFALSSFGGLVQAPRYLLPLYVGLFVLLGVCCEYLMRHKPLVGYLYFAALLAFQSAASYLGGRGIAGEPVVFAGQRVARDHKPLHEVLHTLGITKVRSNYWIGYRLAFETKEVVTFSQIGEPFQVRIPEYESETVAERELWPLVLVKAQVPAMTSALSRMGFSYSQTRAGEYVVVHNLTRIYPERRLATMSTDSLTVNASGAHDPRLALDGDLNTRWGTGAPQSPGQRYEIEFKTPIKLHGVGYSFGKWWADRPRELKIEVEDVLGKRTVVLSPYEAKGAFDISIRDEGFVIRFPAVEARRVIFTQLASDAVFDWSIAEISLLGEDAAK